MSADVLLVLFAYGAGMFPTALLVGRSMGHDPTTEGSGNPGASNVYRLAGFRAGALVFAGDAAKGAIATGAGLAAAGRPLGMACGLAAVAGHMFPAARGFRGGRGVATAAGLATVLFPVVAAGCAAAWLLVARLSDRASLASLLVAVALPVVVALSGRPGWETLCVALLAGLVIVRHAPNLRRLRQGQEQTMHRGTLP